MAGHHSGHSIAMPVCCTVKLTLVRTILFGGGTSGLALSTGDVALPALGLAVAVLAGVALLTRHGRDDGWDASGEPADRAP